MKRLFFVVIAMMVSASSWVMAAAPRTMETDWTWNIYAGKSSAATSTHAVVGVGFSYAVKAVGADVKFHIAHTTRTYTDATVAVSSITSPAVTAVSGDTLSGTFEALVINPAIVISNLDTSATAYIYIHYGQARRQ